MKPDLPLKFHPAAIRASAVFDRSGDPYLVRGTAAATALQVIFLPAIGNGGLVHVDVAGKWSSIRIDHRPAQLVEQEPCRLVGHAQLGLELKGGDAVRVSGDEVRRQEPLAQGQMGALHDCPGNHGGLVAAVRLAALACVLP